MAELLLATSIGMLIGLAIGTWAALGYRRAAIRALRLIDELLEEPRRG